MLEPIPRLTTELPRISMVLLCGHRTNSDLRQQIDLIQRSKFLITWTIEVPRSEGPYFKSTPASLPVR